ncbi:MAG: hypothetical protein P8Z33_14785, partial [Gammaproteobacteria bacterium]
ENIDPDCRRSSENRLLGFCAGINCDSIITTREAHVLLERISLKNDLEDDPRVEVLKHVLIDALEDGRIDYAESNEISQLITCLTGDS